MRYSVDYSNGPSGKRKEWTAMHTLTHPVTAEFPPGVYDLIGRKAASEKKTIAQTVVDLIEDALDYIDDDEDKYLSEIADERIASSDGNYIPLEEVMRKYDAL